MNVEAFSEVDNFLLGRQLLPIRMRSLRRTISKSGIHRVVTNADAMVMFNRKGYSAILIMPRQYTNEREKFREATIS